MAADSRTSVAQLIQFPVSADLERWVAREWRDGLQVDQLMPLDRLLVRTRNSRYDITVISPATGEVLVCGGRFFPEPTRVRIGGASLGGSFLKLRGIYVGFSVEFWCEPETVITCPVLSIRSLATDRVQ